MWQAVKNGLNAKENCMAVACRHRNKAIKWHAEVKETLNQCSSEIVSVALTEMKSIGFARAKGGEGI